MSQQFRFGSLLHGKYQMGPAKASSQLDKPGFSMNLRKGVSTRSQNLLGAGRNDILSLDQPKRKAEVSPSKGKDVKRSAFGDITNAASNLQQDPKKLVGCTSIIQPRTASIWKAKDENKVLPQSIQSPCKNVSLTAAISTFNATKKVQIKLKKLPAPAKVKLPPPKPKTETASKSKTETVIEKSDTTEATEKKLRVPSKVCSQQKLNTTLQSCAHCRSSLSSEDDSLYQSALEVLDETTKKDVAVEEKDDISAINVKVCKHLPDGVEDFDSEGFNDPAQVSIYAMDIFEYLKSRERKFTVHDYMEKQACLNRWMRTLLVDWMVEVQESFELNHETLYLAVKLVDLYLTKVTVSKETLQLIGAASLFISSKFDERVPPLVADFLYICDGAYTHHELTKMEKNVLQTIGFDLGIPVSYRFLRRYARCAKVSMATLTFARYILELSLMDYNFISVSESKIAAASLFLALKTKSISDWTPTLQHYSGYTLPDIKDIVCQLNDMLHKKPREGLSTIRNKYSHKIFFEVAKIPLLDNLLL